VNVPLDDVLIIAVESDRCAIVIPVAGDVEKVNFAPGIAAVSCANAPALTKTESPAMTAPVSSLILTVNASSTTITCELALLPHVEAVMRIEPGFRARTIPTESTVAIVVSDETNLIGTSVRVPPTLFVAVANTWVMSVSRGGE
jgi:hypothetical protein